MDELILKARHNAIIYSFFRWYAVWKTGKTFHPVRIIGDIHDRNLPVLLISNHISWWDGFWAMYVNRKVFKRKFYFMMLEEQLRKYWFFNYSGGFSVKKKTRSVLESLNYASEILDDNGNMLLLFPQGEIQSAYRSSFVFEKGTERILSGKAGRVQVVFMAALTDYFSSPKPGVWFYMEEFKGSLTSGPAIQKGYNDFYSNIINKHIQTPV